MIYYMSAPEALYKPVRDELLADENSYNFLLSFAINKRFFEMFYQEGKNRIMIDSGAFSAWNSGAVIDREEYLAYLKTLPAEVLKINLDVIPQTGSSREEKESCCEQSFQNFLYLSKRVENVLPVHHYGEHIDWARKMLDHTDYICISPANDTAEAVKRQYFGYIWEHLDFSVKTHVLGYSSMSGIKMFPFYSTDSISYKSAHMSGSVTITRADGKAMSISMKDYAKMNGFSYDPSVGLAEQPELLTHATRTQVRAILDSYDRIKNRAADRDWTHLKSQLNLF